MEKFTDAFWTSPDGLQLHYRDYAGDSARPPILCLPGLTRNARDFESLAARLAGQWRVLCPDLRGRGESDYARDPETYVPPTYVADLEAMFEQVGISRFVAIGTSLGGLLTMMLAAQARDRIAGAVLNDVGPVIEPAGLDRIKGTVGKGGTFPTWVHAARALQDNLGTIYPDFDLSDWLVFAKRVMELGPGGRVSFAYDMKIAEPFAHEPKGPSPDLWPLFELLGGRPLLAIRGEFSDILTPATLMEMKRRLPEMETVTVPGVGHAPTLDEPVASQAIDRLLAAVR